MHYAVNLADLTKHMDHGAVKMLLLPLLTRETVKAEDTIDGTAVRVNDTQAMPGGSTQIGAIVQIIRNGLAAWKPIGKADLRIYQSKTGQGWTRI